MIEVALCFIVPIVITIFLWAVLKDEPNDGHGGYG